MKKFGTAVILCGGKSSRMGFDKSKIKINNKLLIETIAGQLEQVFEEIIFLSNDMNKFKGTRYKVVQDIVPNSGPIGAIYTALKHTSSKYIFVTACDMPIINLDYIKYMMEIIETKSVEGVVSYNSGFVEPLYAFYSIDMLEAFKREIEKNNYKILDVITSSNIYYVEDKRVKECCRGENIFINLNYKSDLEILEKI